MKWSQSLRYSTCAALQEDFSSEIRTSETEEEAAAAAINEPMRGVEKELGLSPKAAAVKW